MRGLIGLVFSVAGLAGACSSGGAGASGPNVGMDAGAVGPNIAEGGAGDALQGDAAARASRCTVTPQTIACTHDTTSLADSVGMRTVVYATPLGRRSSCAVTETTWSQRRA